MSELRAVDALQDEIEKAKESLKDVDDNIKKLTGRDPTEQRVVRRPSQTSDLRGRGRLFSAARRGIVEDGASPAKRRLIGTAFSRLGPPHMVGQGRQRADSGDEEDLPNRPTVQSSIVITPKEERSRRESIEAQNTDKRGKARNKRMFGLLLGTLRKFKDEAKETEDKVEQRKQIEQKLEEKAKEEKEEIIKERRQLFIERKQKQAKIQKLEQKMELVQLHEEWVEETNKLVNFIQTKTKPPLFYLPKIMTPDLEKKLADSKTVVDEMIAEKKKRLDAMIEDLMLDDMGKNEKESDEKGEGDHIDKENIEEGKHGKSTTERHYRRRHSEGETHGRSRDHEKDSPSKGGESKRSPRKNHDHSDRRKSGEGERRRESHGEESRKRRRSHADDHEEKSSDKHRRRSDGDRSGRDHDRHHRAGRRGDGQKSGRRDEAPREVKINYDDEEMFEGEVSNENPEKDQQGQISFQGQGHDPQVSDKTEIKTEVKENGDDKREEKDLEKGIDSSERDAMERKIHMAEDAEDGEEGEVHDVMDE